MKLEFYLRFHTKFGQSLFICGNIPVLGAQESDRALPMQFLNEEYWYASVEIDDKGTDVIQYRYIFKNEFGETKTDAEKDRCIDLKKARKDVIVVDLWNDPSFYENAFSTAPFREVYFRSHKFMRLKKSGNTSAQFKIKAPLLSQNEAVCLLGNTEETGSWNREKPFLLQKTGEWWVGDLELKDTSPLSYKYGVYNIKRDEFVRFEDGDNRVLMD